MEFEENNFKVNSTGWEKIVVEGKEYLLCPQKDIIEMENGEQLFTWFAAVRETKKAKKRMPERSEYKEIFMPNIVLAGYRCGKNGKFLGQGEFAYYWTATKENAEKAIAFERPRQVFGGEADVVKTDFFSVRCIKK